MATNFRKYAGKVKDVSSVTMLKVNSQNKDLDVALVKATNHIECPPKEKHVRTLLAATSASRPRADIAYLITGLAKRLSKTHNWSVALKTLMVIHRCLREGDPTFREEIMNFSRSRTHLLNMSNFKDDSSPPAWDYSAWVRGYALFLEERLECFRVLKYDVEAERSSGHSKTRELPTAELLEQLPALQQTLYRLMNCQPEGAATSNFVIETALGLVLKESFKLYRAINDGIINLVDKFFDMARHDAVKALEIYKLAGKQAERLSEFYEACKSLHLGGNFQFPTLEQPPTSFLTTMEEYVKDAPRVSPLPKEQDAYDGDDARSYGSRGSDRGSSVQRQEREPAAVRPSPASNRGATARATALPPQPAALPDNHDLLGMGSNSPDPAALEDANALALAIIPQNEAGSNGQAAPAAANGSLAPESGSGWELALVPSANTNGNSKIGNFDKLTLDSLYEDAMSRRSPYHTPPGSFTTGRPGTNPFEGAPAMHAGADPFAASSKIAPPASVQMAHMRAQQEQLYMQQRMMQQQNFNASNPFGNPYQQQGPAYQNNPFGNPHLM